MLGSRLGRLIRMSETADVSGSGRSLALAELAAPALCGTAAGCWTCAAGGRGGSAGDACADDEGVDELDRFSVDENEGANVSEGD